MTAPDNDELAVLRRARQALSPGREDEQRVLASLGAFFETPAGRVEGIRRTGGAVATAAGSGRLLRFFIGALALGVAGAGGYAWGYRVGVAAERASTVAAPAITTTRSTSPEPVRAGPAQDPAGEIDKARPTPVARSAEARKRDVPGAPNTPALPESGLDEEVRQMRRIERAIREGNPRLALVLAEDLDQSVPNGQLLLERRVATLMASCQLASDGAATRAAEFMQENPSSSYAARLRQICNLPGAEQRTLPASGTNEPKPGGSP